MRTETASRDMRVRIEELEEECRQLRDELRGARFEFDAALRLTKHEVAVLGTLATCAPSILSRGAIYNRVWLDADRCPAEKIVDIYLLRVRRKIAARGASIRTHWGVGWWIEKCDVDKLLRRA